MKTSIKNNGPDPTTLGRQLLSGSLTDASLQRATEDTPDFAILPWVNVVKVGGQSIMDRGRSAVYPLVDEIVANLGRHKMILGTGAGTRRAALFPVDFGAVLRRAAPPAGAVPPARLCSLGSAGFFKGLCRHNEVRPRTQSPTSGRPGPPEKRRAPAYLPRARGAETALA